jgi:hypothetical protein
MMTISGVSLLAQDRNRAPEANQGGTPVDVSVHAEVGERAKQQPQLPEHRRKQLDSYSHWGSQPPTQSPVTRFRPAETTTTPNATKSVNVNGLLDVGGLSFPPQIQIHGSMWPAGDSSTLLPTKGCCSRADRASRLFCALSADGSREPESFKPTVPPLYIKAQTHGLLGSFREKQSQGTSRSPFPNPTPRANLSLSHSRANARQYRLLPPIFGDKTPTDATSRFSSNQGKQVDSLLASRPK